MIVVENLFRYLLTQYLIGEHHADKAYARLWGLITKVSLWVVGVTIAMWAINAYVAMPRLNLFFFYLGTPVILFLVFAPRVQVVGLTVSILGTKLGGASLAESIKKGVGSWYNVVRAALMWFWVVSGFLSTMPFANSPSVFWLIAAMSLVGMVVILHFQLAGKWLPWLILAYVTGVTVLGFVELVPKEVLARTTTEKSTRVTEVAKRERVIPVRLVLPANGVAVTEHLLLCSVLSFTDEQMKKVRQARDGEMDKFISKHEIDIPFTVWYYDTNGNCEGEFRRLKELRLFK